MKNKKNVSVLNKVILIGSSHHNTLGIVRGFGRNGIKPYGILIDNGKKAVGKSKYWADYSVVDNLSDIIPLLMEKYSHEDIRPVIIPVFDEDAAIIDQNYNSLKEYFLMPSIDEKQGAIVNLMDKQTQYEWAVNRGIKMLPSKVLDISQQAAKVELPVILKPVASIEGKKYHIRICQTNREYEEAMAMYEANGYERILAQRYLSDRKEYCCSGAVSRSGGMEYTVVENIRNWPKEYGVGSYAAVVTEKRVLQYAGKLLSEAIKIGYAGPIDIEFFRDAKGEFYLNEYNWRCSGRNYASLCMGIYPVVDYYFECIGVRQMTSHYTRKNGFVCDERIDLRNVLNRNITLIQWLKDVKKAKGFSFWDSRDMLPALYEYMRLMKTAVEVAVCRE